MGSKARIEVGIKRKRDPELFITLIKLKKTNPVVARELSRPKRSWPSINLKEIDLIEGDVLVAGKVLGAGDLQTSKKIVAWSISKKALEKITKAKGTFKTIREEIKKNPRLDGLDMLR